jgi:hypothetical protein
VTDADIFCANKLLLTDKPLTKLSPCCPKIHPRNVVLRLTLKSSMYIDYCWLRNRWRKLGPPDQKNHPWSPVLWLTLTSSAQINNSWQTNPGWKLSPCWLCIKSIIKSLILHMYLLFLFGFFIIIDVLFSNEVSFNVSIGFWSLNELFQKIQRRNSEQRIEEKFSWRLKKILVQISAPNLPQKSILFQF